MPQLTHPIEGEVEGGMPYTKYAGGFLHSSATSVGASIADDCVRFNDPGKVTLLLTFMVPKVQDPYPTKARLSVDIAFAHLDRPYRLNLVVDQDCLTTSDEFPLKMEQEL